jgi:drug/metabolite transporter (DMT)-like permease
VTFRKYLVLVSVTICAAVGETLLSRGMKEIGGVSLHHLTTVIFAITNPWVALGILFLLGFFVTYNTALSWADLTYVLPATSLSYVLLAFIARFMLHEQISLTRWLGILLISSGVGFVTRGPALTEDSNAITHRHEPAATGSK